MSYVCKAIGYIAIYKLAVIAAGAVLIVSACLAIRGAVEAASVFVDLWSAVQQALI